MSSNSSLEPLPYETRNLGLECFAVSGSFIENPNKETLLHGLKGKQSEFGKIFVQARITKRYLPVAGLLEDSGFHFVESTVSPHALLARNRVLESFMRDRNAYLPKRYAADELEFLTLFKPDKNVLQDIKIIARESVFDDRFHLDNLCDPEMADRRYGFWLEDMAKDPATTFHLLTYRQKTIAFWTRKMEDLLLGGFSPQYAKSGLGEFLWLTAMAKMREEGLNHATTTVSVNNLASLNLHARLGFKLKNTSATFHYWSDRRS